MEQDRVGKGQAQAVVAVLAVVASGADRVAARVAAVLKWAPAVAGVPAGDRRETDRQDQQK